MFVTLLSLVTASVIIHLWPLLKGVLVLLGWLLLIGHRLLGKVLFAPLRLRGHWTRVRGYVARVRGYVARVHGQRTRKRLPLLKGD